MSEAPTQERKANPLKAFLSGGFGGICNVLTGHPLDTIKVRLQTMPRPAPGQPPMYKGTFDCAAKTIKNEGVRGLYKGMSAPLTGVAPIFALCFAGYALGKRVQQTGENTKLTYKQIAVAGSFSGLMSTIIMAPGERIKCLLQVQQASGGERKYKGMLDTAVKLYKEGGIRSVYKGSCATMLRDLPANAFYFLAYEYIQDQIKERTGSEKISVGSTIFAGGAAGIAYWVVGMPADVLKSRLQTAPAGMYPKGVRSVFKDLIRTDGPLALYRGVTPIMLRAFPANAACFFDLPSNAAYFATYEMLQDFQKKKFPDMRMGELTAIFSGGIAGIMYWIVGMPPDVLKSRLQTAPPDKYKHGVRSVFMELIKNDGPLALYRGVAPVMIRAFPANAACFFGIELANSFITFVAPNF